MNFVYYIGTKTKIKTESFSGETLKQYVYSILCICLVLLLSVGCAEKPLDQKITDDINSSVKYGTITEVIFSKETGTLTVSDTLDIEKSKSLLGTDSLLVGLQTMEVAEKYPEIKLVSVFVTTNNPYVPKVVSLETHTGSGINWHTEFPYGDLIAYSKAMFEKAEWYVTPTK